MGPENSRTSKTNATFRCLGIKDFIQVNTFVDETASSSTLKKKIREEAIVVAASPNGKHLAVGYQNGMIKLFTVTQDDNTVNFHGHKSSVTTLTFTHDSATLISGSKVGGLKEMCNDSMLFQDTDIIAWDLITEAGLYRLRGHKAPVTKVLIMKNQPILISR